MPNVSWQTPSNSWQAHLRTMNETDAANRHFGAFIDAMATENSKIEKINTITEDPDSIMLVVEGKKIKFIHSCKKFGGTRTNPTMTIACPYAKEREHSQSSLIRKMLQPQRKCRSPWTPGSGRAKMSPN